MILIYAAVSLMVAISPVIVLYRAKQQLRPGPRITPAMYVQAYKKTHSARALMDMLSYLQKRQWIVPVQLGTGAVLLQSSRPKQGMAHETFLLKWLFSYATDGRLSPDDIRFQLADESRRGEFSLQLERYEELIKEDLVREGYAVDHTMILGTFIASVGILAAGSGVLLFDEPVAAIIPAAGAVYSFYQLSQFPWTHHRDKMAVQSRQQLSRAGLPFLFQDPGEFKLERSIVPVYAAGSGAIAAGSFQLDEFRPVLENALSSELMSDADPVGNDG
ncbi:hypothetical protein [Alkalicoccus luteus]|uniref:hypothetical protein n=1 Tax=Alkalicoccus luteus TaxID=1237094 RepID=UPI004033AF58